MSPLVLNKWINYFFVNDDSSFNCTLFDLDELVETFVVEDWFWTSVSNKLFHLKVESGFGVSF